MNQERRKPEDMLFLLSCALDQDLPETQRRRLDEALAAEPSLRLQADQLHALDRLIKRWAAQWISADWARFETGVLARLADEAGGDDLRKVDRMLARWARGRPAVDEEAFVQAVLSRLRRADRAGAWHRGVLRIRGSLAAAAAVALAVTAMIWFTAARTPVVNVAIGPAVSTAYASPAPGSARVVVSFTRAPGDAARTALPEPEISFTAVGASPTAASADDGFPL